MTNKKNKNKSEQTEHKKTQPQAIHPRQIIHDELITAEKVTEEVEHIAAAVEHDAEITEKITTATSLAFLWMRQKAEEAGNSVAVALAEIAQDVSLNIHSEAEEVEQDAEQVESFSHQAANLLKTLADYIDDKPPTGETRLTLTNN